MMAPSISRIRHCASMVMLASLLSLALTGLLGTDAALATERDNVARIVAVGDLHGDLKQFKKVLQDASVIDSRSRWIGGETHLVQIGDVPDRGPDTDRIIALLKKLERQARKAGGEVHAMIGNHEAMNMGGDLRYVHPGEFDALTDRRSRRRQDDYYRRSVQHIKEQTPAEDWPEFNKAHRQAFNKRFPLGFVEHRSAWSNEGEFGSWVLEHSAVVRINTTLFVHGGIAPDQPLKSISEINLQVRKALAEASTVSPDAIIYSPDGPLWHRGLSVMPETPANEALLDRLLAFYAVERIVIAHTPLVGTILPRFGGKVILADVGLSAHYGGARACLVIDQSGPYVLLAGQRVDLPDSEAGVDGLVAYLRRSLPLMTNQQRGQKFIDSLLIDSAQ